MRYSPVQSNDAALIRLHSVRKCSRFRYTNCDTLDCIQRLSNSRSPHMPTFFARHAGTFATLATVILAFVGLIALVDQRFNAQDRYTDQGFAAVN